MPGIYSKYIRVLPGGYSQDIDLSFQLYSLLPHAANPVT